jgi:hypothetical protein
MAQEKERVHIENLTILLGFSRNLVRMGKRFDLGDQDHTWVKNSLSPYFERTLLSLRTKINQYYWGCNHVPEQDHAQK